MKRPILMTVCENDCYHYYITKCGEIVNTEQILCFLSV